MVALFCFLLTLFASPFKSKSRLEAENAALRNQLTVLRRKVRGRVQLTSGDRLFLIQLYRWFPSVLKTIMIVRPETLVRWHRAGFRRLSLPQTQKQLTDARESVDSSIDERSLQVDLVRLDRAVPVAGCVGSRNPYPPTPA
jgi:hypothetical protein